MLLVILYGKVQRVPTASFSNNNHYCNLASSYATTNEGAFYADQFETESNFKVHFESTGPEIYEQTNGKECTSPKL